MIQWRLLPPIAGARPVLHINQGKQDISLLFERHTGAGQAYMRIELNCTVCGDNSFTIIRGMDDDATVSCSECGHRIGTMAELKERVAAEVMRRAKARPASGRA